MSRTEDDRVITGKRVGWIQIWRQILNRKQIKSLKTAHAQWKITKICEEAARIYASYKKSASLNRFPVTNLRPEVECTCGACAEIIVTESGRKRCAPIFLGIIFLCGDAHFITLRHFVRCMMDSEVSCIWGTNVLEHYSLYTMFKNRLDGPKGGQIIN